MQAEPALHCIVLALSITATGASVSTHCQCGLSVKTNLLFPADRCIPISGLQPEYCQFTDSLLSAVAGITGANKPTDINNL